jgi:hypothetical protein
MQTATSMLVWLALLIYCESGAAAHIPELRGVCMLTAVATAPLIPRQTNSAA